MTRSGCLLALVWLVLFAASIAAWVLFVAAVAAWLG